MNTVSAIAGLLVIAALFCALVRIFRGPSAVDRIIAFDLLVVSLVGLVILLSIRWATSDYLEFMLLLSCLGFLSTVALVHYLHHSYRPGEDDDEPEVRP